MKATCTLMTAALAVGFAQFTLSNLLADDRTPGALVGQVSSDAEGPMEGVVVTARKDGSIVSVREPSGARGTGRLLQTVPHLRPEAPGTGSSITSTTTVSTAAVLGGFTGLALFRATFFTRARLGLALAKRFLGAGLATARFT